MSTLRSAAAVRYTGEAAVVFRLVGGNCVGTLHLCSVALVRYVGVRCVGSVIVCLREHFGVVRVVGCWVPVYHEGNKTEVWFCLSCLA